MNTKEDSLYIKRLKERLRQKPDSKVFLSFAEELRKKDRIEDAITVLIDGVKKNPDFIAARLTLARWYLSSDMSSEAKKEFSEIIERTPDNIFARRGLKEAYRRLGEPIAAKEAVVSQLSTFLEAVKLHFSPEPEVFSNSVKDKAIVVGRLDRFLEAVKMHFNPKDSLS